MAPLSPTRYAVRFTASAELNEKLNRLRSPMRCSVPDGDLARLIEDAVNEKPERLEARRFGKTSKPRKSLEQTDTTPAFNARFERRTRNRRDIWIVSSR